MKPTKFVSIDHHSSRGGGDTINVDLAGVVSAIRDLTKKIDSLKIDLPAPIVNVTTPEVKISLPEMSPTVEVHPTDVVMQKSDGSFVSPIVNVDMQIPWLPFILMGAAPVIVMLVDLFLRMP